MKIHRIDTGIIAYPPPGETYRPSPSIPWVGATEDDLLPVVEII